MLARVVFARGLFSFGIINAMLFVFEPMYKLFK